MDPLPKIIANILLNLPADTREWLISHVSPETFRRWVKQMNNNVISRKDLLNKIKDIKEGREKFSDLAIYEGCHYGID